jgi:hypothetical protein
VNWVPSGTRYNIAAGDHSATVVEIGAGIRTYTLGGNPVLDGYPIQQMRHRSTGHSADPAAQPDDRRQLPRDRSVPPPSTTPSPAWPATVTGSPGGSSPPISGRATDRAAPHTNPPMA